MADSINSESAGGHRARIVHLCQGLEMGGMEKLLVEFARHADRNHFDLHFISMTGKGCLAAEIESLGWPVTALDQMPGLRPAMIPRIAKLFRSLKADLVHTHNSKPLLYGSPAARAAGIGAVIHTRHGQGRNASRRQSMMLYLAARCVQRIVSVSQDSTQLAAHQGLPGDKLTTIYNGIDLSRFPFSGPCESGAVIAVGRLSPEKDIPTLLHAAVITATQEPSFRLRVFGAGPCLKELEQLCEQLGLRDRVEFAGQATDVAAKLAESRLLVLPSLTEGISLALLEAMAVGLPTVATNVGGNPEVVVDGLTGLLVPKRSPQLLADAMLKIYREPNLGRAMGLAGRNRVETLFNARQMVASYESLYLESLGRAVSLPKAA